MRVSAKTDYALRALLEMSSRTDGKPVSAEELGPLRAFPTASCRRSWPTCARPAW